MLSYETEKSLLIQLWPTTTWPKLSSFPAELDWTAGCVWKQIKNVSSKLSLVNRVAICLSWLNEDHLMPSDLHMPLAVRFKVQLDLWDGGKRQQCGWEQFPPSVLDHLQPIKLHANRSNSHMWCITWLLHLLCSTPKAWAQKRTEQPRPSCEKHNEMLAYFSFTGVFREKHQK